MHTCTIKRETKTRQCLTGIAICTVPADFKPSFTNDTAMTPGWKSDSVPEPVRRWLHSGATGPAPTWTQNRRNGDHSTQVSPSHHSFLPHALLPSTVCIYLWRKHIPYIFSFSTVLPQAEKKTNSKDSESWIFPLAQEVNYQLFFLSQQPVFCVRKTALINLDGVYAGEVIFQLGKVVLRPLPLRFFSEVISSNTLNWNSITKQIYLS